MIRSTLPVAFTFTSICHNYFPFGRSSGPKMIQKILPRSNLDPNSMLVSKHRKANKEENKESNWKRRRDLVLHCKSCHFEWQHDALTVRCTNSKEHNQREIWHAPFWKYYNHLPENHNKYMPLAKNPRTGSFLNREFTKSMNNERRGMIGMSTRSLRVEKERNRLARHVGGIGSFSQTWKTRFPYPT
eukprot:Tbor_TRINITY_DN5102_c1_g4::TRINITY_DN5102_c1_g4_i1::g.26335::m.26335